MFDFNLMKITAEQIQSGRTLSEALDVAEARRIYFIRRMDPSILPTINLHNMMNNNDLCFSVRTEFPHMAV